MKETPIIMSTENVKAILDSKKTMTRRVMKPPPEELSAGYEWRVIDGVLCAYRFHPQEGFETGAFDEEIPYRKCPYGQVGDRMWVKETWRLEMHSGCFDVAYKDTVWKKDAGSNPYMTKYAHLRDKTWIWRPSIFMPRWASRINLEIIEVRVERLQEINGEDACSEGITLPFRVFGDGDSEYYESIGETYIDHFRTLWDSLNAKRGYGWDTNCWVWVIEFKVIK